jgi:hypothetical protein
LKGIEKTQIMPCLTIMPVYVPEASSLPSGPGCGVRVNAVECLLQHRAVRIVRDIRIDFRPKKDRSLTSSFGPDRRVWDRDYAASIPMLQVLSVAEIFLRSRP